MHYVVSDIHGCFNALDSALRLAKFDKTKDTLYILGDVLDRGPQNAEIVNFIVENADCIKLLKGNHEDMWLVDTAKDYENLLLIAADAWSENHACSGCYKETSKDLLMGTTTAVRKQFFDMIDNAPLLRVLDIQGQMIVLVHAGLRPPTGNKSWLDQTEKDLLWIRDPWLSTFQTTNFLTIFGHTPVQLLNQYELKNNRYFVVEKNGFYRNMISTPRVAYWNNKIDIDCGCSMGGVLALMCLETFDVLYTNQDGLFVMAENLRDRYCL